MSIIISKPGVGPAALVAKSHFGREDNLQAYIHINPEAIPVYDIREDKRLFVAAREFATESGPIDALAVDKDGDIYIIETKLYGNADKRRVVAQALDYGASLWKHFSDFSTFLRLLDTHVQRQWQMAFQQKIRDHFALDDAGTEATLNRMQENLRSGNLKFVILMDSMDERLKELITYVNLKSQFDIYAVELELYEYEDYKIVLPKLYGAEMKKDNPPPAQKPPLTEEELLRFIEARRTTVVSWANSLFARLRRMRLTSRATGSTITHGIEFSGEFVPLLGFQAGNVYAALSARTVRALGRHRFIECKSLMNELVPNGPVKFYDVTDNPESNISRGPDYPKLEQDIEKFAEKLNRVIEIVTSAFPENGTPDPAEVVTSLDI